MSLSATGSGWAAAAPHSLATDAAADAFRRGGNALDAALAAATTLAVVYPHMCGVGGDLIALVRGPSGATTCILSAGAAPAAIDPEDVRSRHSGVMPSHGPDAITVPGAVAGWASLHGAGAVLPWATAFERAIGCARDGVEVSRDLAAALSWDPERLSADPGLAGVFFGGGAPPQVGQTLDQPALASTLETLSEHGASAMYGGDVGRRFASGLRARDSALSLEDLTAHSATLDASLEGTYRGNRVLTSPPPSQGFVLLRILADIEARGLEPDPLGVDAPALAGLFAGASALRDRHLADPAAMRVSVEELMEAELPPGGQPKRGTGDTISLMCADAKGWSVSLIQSLYDGFGSGILEPETGIVAHDRGACFTLERGHPNELAPRKRPAHTLMPVMVELSDSSLVVAGTMGGEAQPQINAQNLMRLLDMEREPAEALSAPRWTVEGSTATLEGDVPEAVASSLSAIGFTIESTERHSGDLGHSNLILRRSDALLAASDPRADGSAEAEN